MSHDISRRELLSATLAGAAGALAARAGAAPPGETDSAQQDSAQQDSAQQDSAQQDSAQQDSAESNAPESGAAGHRLAVFSADVTPPLGHPLLGGWIRAARVTRDPLLAKGVILLGAGEPIVLAALDWCELRNATHDRWRDALAAAVGTRRSRVLLACVHQHDAPYADARAQALLHEAGLKNPMFDPAFEATALARVADAANKSLAASQPCTHYSAGSAAVEGVACNRRVELASGRPRFHRYSFTSDAATRDAPEGEIDPLFSTLGFWNGDAPLAAVGCYAVHPMSSYGRGEVSADFVGQARRAREKETGVPHVYFSGCAGDVTAAKFNTGDDAGRARLAERLRAGWAAAWKAAERWPLKSAALRVAEVAFVPETSGRLAPETLRALVHSAETPYVERCNAALGLSWQERCAAGQPIELPALDLGAAAVALLPAEAFVAFQRAARESRPDAVVLTPAYPGLFTGEGILEPPRASKKLSHKNFLRRLGAEHEFARGLAVGVGFSSAESHLCGTGGREFVDRWRVAGVAAMG